MCNFVIRPIKSFCTVDIYTGVGNGLLIQRGDSLDVERIEADSVVGIVNGSAGVAIPLQVFLHAFTTDQKSVSKVKTEEQEWFKPKSEKKQSKSVNKTTTDTEKDSSPNKIEGFKAKS